MCGLAAFFPIDEVKPEQLKTAFAKMKILGLYNKSRGKHSCGFYIDSTIHKGVNLKKEFDDFIQNTMLAAPTEVGAMMIHTRHATVGAHDEKNAHPFLIDGDPLIVFMHNGTIKNIKKLCEKYKVEHSYTKVDSLLLGEILQKSQNLEVLNDYIGTAALIWADFTHDNIGYVYHGKSLQAVNGQPVEERPLYFLQTEEGLYFSSIEESLDAICDADWHEVHKLEYNKVFQISNGTFSAYHVDVKRTTEQETTYYGKGCGMGGYDYDDYYDGYYNEGWPTYGQNSRVRPKGQNLPARAANVHHSATPASKLFVMDSMVWREAFPDHAICTEDKVFFWRGRYVDHKKKLMHGVYYLRHRGYISSKEVMGATVYYFFRGVMLRNYTDHNVLQTLDTRMDSWVHNDAANFAKEVSRHSVHPVTNLDDESAEIACTPRYIWYAGGEICRCSFTPKFAGRHYKINEIGELTDIVNSGGKGKVLIYKTLDEAIRADVDDEDQTDESPLDAGVVAMRDIESPDTHGVFDTVFDDLHSVIEIISEDEYNALLLYLADHNEVDKNGNYLDMSTYLNSRIGAGCIVGQTLREVVGDKGYRLESYLEQLADRKETLEAMSIESQFTEIVDNLLDMENLGDELQSNTDNDLAQDLCYAVYKALGPLKEELISLASKSELDTLLKKLENSKKNA